MKEKDVFSSEEDTNEDTDIFVSKSQEEKVTDEWVIPSDEVVFKLNGKEQEKKSKIDIGKASISVFMTDMLRKMGIKSCIVMIDGKLLLQKDAVKTNFDKIDIVNIVTISEGNIPVNKEPKKTDIPKPAPTKMHTHVGRVGSHLKIDKHINPTAQKAHDKAMEDEVK